METKCHNVACACEHSKLELIKKYTPIQGHPEHINYIKFKPVKVNLHMYFFASTYTTVITSIYQTPT